MTANQETSLRERLLAAAKGCEVYSPDQCATLIDGIGWIAMRALLREAADAIDQAYRDGYNTGRMHAARAEPQAGEVALLEEYGRGYDAGFEIGDRLANADLDAMVDRFLAWKLPADFRPDAGITFAPNPAFQSPGNPNWPTGTNLLTAAQARAMFEHCAAPSPASLARPEAQGEACETCGGRGEVGGNLGQTPESFDLRTEPCPDCSPPADRAPGEVGEAEPFAAMLDRLAGDEPSAAVATMYREAAALIRRLAARAPSAQGEVGYIGVHVAAALRKGRSVATTITPHMAMTDDVAIYTSAPAAGDGDAERLRVALRSIQQRAQCTSYQLGTDVARIAALALTHQEPAR